ncbi:hypothetical protein KI429_22180 [Pseudomonas shirazica]|nr:hypothetical protein KI429_22180 [Pseudomonas shirazica]
MSRPHVNFFDQLGACSSGISAIRIVEQAIAPVLFTLPNLPKNGGLVLFGIPNVGNQALANLPFWSETLCINGMGHALQALDFPFAIAIVAAFFAGRAPLSLACGVLT